MNNLNIIKEELEVLGHTDLANIITAAKIDETLDKSGLSEEDQKTVRDINSKLSSKSKYVSFIVKNYKSKDLVDLINTFEKKSQLLSEKDINKYTAEELRKTLESTGPSKSEKRTEIKTAGAEKICENDKYTVYLIKTKEASILYGKGTKWCTAASEGENYFDIHNKDRNLYYLIPKSGIDNVTEYSNKIAVAVYPDNKKEVFNAQDKKISESEVPKDILSKLKVPDALTKFKSILIDNKDGTYSSDRDVDVSKELVKNGKLQIKFKHVKGFFDCSSLDLTSLEGCPETIGGDFDCAYNKITSLEGSPKTIGGNFDCSNNKLTSLEGAPKIVHRWFDCAWNDLTSLKSSPKIVGGYFSCSYNKLTSLEGAPKNVGRDFYCNNNRLESLEGSPKIVGEDFICSENQLTDLKGAPETVGGDFVCFNNTKRLTEEDIRSVCNVKGHILVKEII